MGGSVEGFWCAILKGDFLSGAAFVLVGASARKRRYPGLMIVPSRLGLGAACTWNLQVCDL